MFWKKGNAPGTNAPEGDVGPFDSEGWKVHDDGSRVHRYRCTIHDGDGCDGRCAPGDS